METQWKVTPQALTELVDLNPDMSSYKLLILNNPGNPSGTVYTAEELKALAVICRQKQIIVLSDEIYSLLNFNGNHSSLLDFYPEGTLVTSGFSKWSSAGGWRIGYIIIPKELNTMNRILQSAASQTYSCAPAPMQYAIAQVIAPLIFWVGFIVHLLLFLGIMYTNWWIGRLCTNGTKNSQSRWRLLCQVNNQKEGWSTNWFSVWKLIFSKAFSTYFWNSSFCPFSSLLDSKHCLVSFLTKKKILGGR